MASIEVAIRSLLLQEPGIAAAVGDRISPALVPERDSYPAITYVIDDDPDMILTGSTGIVEADLDLTIWARSSAGRSGYATARELAQLVRDRLLGAPGVIEGIDLMAISGGRIQMGPPDMTTQTWQAWVEAHVIARPV